MGPCVERRVTNRTAAITGARNLSPAQGQQEKGEASVRALPRTTERLYEDSNKGIRSFVALFAPLAALTYGIAGRTGVSCSPLGLGQGSA